MSVICIKTPQVIFAGECEVSFTTTPVRIKNFEELKNVTKKVTIDDWTVGDGKILFDGTLHTNVQYKRRDKIVGDINIDTPFSCCAEAPGALIEDRVEVEFAFVALEREFVGIPPADLAPVDVFEKFWEKVCIRIRFKVIRDVQVSIDTVEPSICPNG